MPAARRARPTRRARPSRRRLGLPARPAGPPRTDVPGRRSRWPRTATKYAAAHRRRLGARSQAHAPAGRQLPARPAAGRRRRGRRRSCCSPGAPSGDRPTTDADRRPAARHRGPGRQGRPGSRGHDATSTCRLIGWPWAEDTFSWVEPTAWACLALRAAGPGRPPARAGRAAAAARPGVRHRRGELRQPHRPRQDDRADPRADGAAAARPAGRDGPAAGRRGEGLPARARREDDRPRTPRLDQARPGRSRRRRGDAGGAAASSTSGSATRWPSRPTATAGLGAGPLRLALAALALDADARNPFRLTDPPRVGRRGRTCRPGPRIRRAPPTPGRSASGSSRSSAGSC